MKLTLGFSPCPNDTFIFDALVNKKIDTGDLDFEPVLEDVQTLNEWATDGKVGGPAHRKAERLVFSHKWHEGTNERS